MCTLVCSAEGYTRTYREKLGACPFCPHWPVAKSKLARPKVARLARLDDIRRRLSSGFRFYHCVGIVVDCRVSSLELSLAEGADSRLTTSALPVMGLKLLMLIGCSPGRRSETSAAIDLSSSLRSTESLLSRRSRRYSSRLT